MLLGPILVLVGGTYVYLASGRFVSTDNAYVKSSKVALAAQVSGPVVSVDVSENQHVAKGDVLFRIDRRTFQVALDRAEAEVMGESDAIAGLKAAYRQSRAELDLARTDAAYAETEFRRQSALADRKVVSDSKLDQARHDVDAARQRIRIIEEQLDQIRAQLGGDADIAPERHPRVLAARAARAAAELDLSHTELRAPFAGVVGKVPEPGQYVTAGAPAISLVADTGAWIEANFKEDELTNVAVGQPVSIEVDTYPGRHWFGRVQSISQATGAEFAILPPQNATGNWVKVVQRIPVRIAVDPVAGGPQLRAGMSTSVEVDTGRGYALAGTYRDMLSWITARSQAETVR